ncbi:MAG: helix-turn-helix domain-containing protein [Pseudohongiellaceae bacterium]
MKKSKLIELRESRNLSRYRVAEDTGIPYNTLARLEDPNGKQIGRAELRILSEYYGSDLTLEHFLS